MLFWSVLIDAFAYRFPRLGHFFKARPRPLIPHGELDRRVMRRELMTREELTAQLRLAGVDDIALVERAYIEPNGMISVIKRGDEAESDRSSQER